MAYNLPPPPEGGVNGGLPGLGGFGLPGFGKSFNLDVGGGFGLPGLGGFGGGGLPFPGWAPYEPITPLGSLWGFKGDLIVPMVAIGVAIFILLLIVLAVKYALAWKLEVLDDLAGNKKVWRRDAGSAPAEHLLDSNLNRLADIVAAAVYSEGCSRRILCEIGKYARDGKQSTSLIRLLELIVPEEYHESFQIVRQSSEGDFDCADDYPCGNIGNKKPPNSTAADSINEIDVTKGKTGGQKATSPSAASAASNPGATATTSAPGVTPTPNAGTSDATPAPSVFGKFKRSMFDSKK